MSSTIFARSSGSGRAGVTVFRLSGPNAGAALSALTGSTGRPRHARLATVRLKDGSVLDRGLALWFPGPASFTGEDVAELHLHGSVAVERALSDELTDLGLEPAAAGAFTLRAFENGKLDLAQAEGLADLLRAETEGQRRHALGQLGGRLSDLVAGWRAVIVACMARLTAAIDFADEEDVPDGVDSAVRDELTALDHAMAAALSGADSARRLRDGVRVVLTGPPNAGKSSLLNALAGEDRAIVSSVAGTTRDVIEVRMVLGDHLVVLVDTAGLRDTTDPVERIGVERAQLAASQADLRLHLLPFAEVSEEAADDDGMVCLATKADLNLDPDATLPAGWIPVSVRGGGGLDALISVLTTRLVAGSAGPITRERHLRTVGAAREAIQAAATAVLPELAAASLGEAIVALDEVTGRIGVEEVLGAVFGEFCIGK